MCPFYLDGEPATALHKNGSGAITHLIRTARVVAVRSLAFVQFSSVVEDGRRGFPAPRSLRTEQRSGQGRGCVLARLKSRRRFRNAVLQSWLDGRL